MTPTSHSLQRFHNLVREYRTFVCAASPVVATELGIHDYDDQLGDFSRAAILNKVEQARRFLKELRLLDRSGWPAEAEIDYLWLEANVKIGIREVSRQRELWRNPILYVNLVLYGAYLLLVRDFAPLEERLRHVVARLREVPRVLEDAKANLRNPPRLWVDIAVESAEGGLGLFSQWLPEVASAVPHPALQAEVALAGREGAAALAGFITFLREDLRRRARGRFAVGREVYDRMLREDHFLDLDADDLLRLGQRVFQELKARCEELAAQVAPGLDWREAIRRLGDDHPAAGQLLEAYRQAMQRARDFSLQRGLVTLPGDEHLTVQTTPPSLWGVVPYAAYLPPAPFDDKAEGVFWVTPVSPNVSDGEMEAQLRGHGRAKIPLVALHEAYPGHHLQLVWSKFNTSDVRRQFLSSLLAEGWAFYCEELMEREGFLVSPAELLQRAVASLWRAARVVLDVSLHTREMTPQEAIDVLVGIGLEKVAARAEVQRYTYTPTQPMTYLVGKIEIERLVAKRRQMEGARFDLARFHTDLLRCGTIPPPLIARQIGVDGSSHA